jgi:hypothetical protein
MAVKTGRRIFHFSRTIVALILCTGGAAGALAASEIQGRVMDQTRGAPAPGDEVILLRLDKGMQEESRTKTDADGAFRIALQQPEKEYLVRVVHQGVNYDQRAAAGTVLAMGVFDAAQNVSGIRGTIEILRAGTTGPTGTVLHVSDMYEIKNDSNPPLTKVGPRTFEAYLPANATLDSVLAAGPGKIGVVISARSVRSEPGHFTVDFPLRPGANKFAFNYDVPYDGHVAFQTRRAYAVQQFAVMLPQAMKFATQSTAFAVLAAGNPKYQVEATKELRAGRGPEFELSGDGELPALSAGAGKQEQAAVAPSAAAGKVAAPNIGAIQEQAKNHVEIFTEALVLAVVATVLLATVVVMSRKRVSQRRKPNAGALSTDTQREQAGYALLDALRQELWRLDNDRSRGTISETDYASTKQALERSWERVIAKQASSAQ